MIGGMNGGAAGAGAGMGIGIGAGTGAGAGTRTGAATGAGACTGAGGASTCARGSGAGTGLAGATTLWLRLGRELADGRMLNASEITSAITPTTKMINTPIVAKNGVRLGCSASNRPKSGYMPVVKSSPSSTSA
jgi:hypothetical protein